MFNLAHCEHSLNLISQILCKVGSKNLSLIAIYIQICGSCYKAIAKSRFIFKQLLLQLKGIRLQIG